MCFPSSHSTSSDMRAWIGSSEEWPKLAQHPGQLPAWGWFLHLYYKASKFESTSTRQFFFGEYQTGMLQKKPSRQEHCLLRCKWKRIDVEWNHKEWKFWTKRMLQGCNGCWNLSPCFTQIYLLITKQTDNSEEWLLCKLSSIHWNQSPWYGSESGSHKIIKSKKGKQKNNFSFSANMRSANQKKTGWIFLSIEIMRPRWSPVPQ